MTKALMDSWQEQLSGGVHTQGQLPSPSASVTSLSSDTGDRPLTGALGSGKAAPPAGQHRGDTIVDLERTVERVLAVNRVIEKQEARRKEAEREAYIPENRVSEFEHLLKHGGDPNRIPHDCLEHLNRNLVCWICGAQYEICRLSECDMFHRKPAEKGKP